MKYNFWKLPEEVSGMTVKTYVVASLSMQSVSSILFSTYKVQSSQFAWSNRSFQTVLVLKSLSTFRITGICYSLQNNSRITGEPVKRSI